MCAWTAPRVFGLDARRVRTSGRAARGARRGEQSDGQIIAVQSDRATVAAGADRYTNCTLQFASVPSAQRSAGACLAELAQRSQCVRLHRCRNDAPVGTRSLPPPVSILVVSSSSGVCPTWRVPLVAELRCAPRGSRSASEQRQAQQLGALLAKAPAFGSRCRGVRSPGPVGLQEGVLSVLRPDAVSSFV